MPFRWSILRRCWRRPRARLFLLSAVALGAAVVWTQHTRDMRKLILADEHGYTRRAGWVNWRHAEPLGTRDLLRDVETHWQKAGGDSFPIRFRQCMAGIYLGVRVESSVEHHYEVSGLASPADVRWAAWLIFKNVSEDFERAQETLPDSLLADSVLSGCRDGDLMGNLLSFQCAVQGLTVRELRVALEALPAPQAASLWTSGQQAKNRTWQPHDWLGTVDLPALLQPPPVPAEWASAHVRLRHRERRSFRLSIPD